MLALLERCVTDAGGAYAFADTDSMAIVANESGGLIACEGGKHQFPDGKPAIRALSWAEVDGIVRAGGHLIIEAISNTDGTPSWQNVAPSFTNTRCPERRSTFSGSHETLRNAFRLVFPCASWALKTPWM